MSIREGRDEAEGVLLRQRVRGVLLDGERLPELLRCDLEVRGQVEGGDVAEGGDDEQGVGRRPGDECSVDLGPVIASFAACSSGYWVTLRERFLCAAARSGDGPTAPNGMSVATGSWAELM